MSMIYKGYVQKHADNVLVNFGLTLASFLCFFGWEMILFYSETIRYMMLTGILAILVPTLIHYKQTRISFEVQQTAEAEFNIILEGKSTYRTFTCQGRADAVHYTESFYSSGFWKNKYLGLLFYEHENKPAITLFEKRPPFNPISEQWKALDTRFHKNSVSYMSAPRWLGGLNLEVLKLKLGKNI